MTRPGFCERWSPSAARASSPKIHRAELPTDTLDGLGASNVPWRRSKSSPLPLRRGAANEEEESTDRVEADQRPSRLDLTAAPPESSLHSSSVRPERSSSSLRGMFPESSFKAASEESFSLEQGGQLRDVTASERAPVEKTSPALAAVISVHSTKDFFFWRAPEGHLTYKLPVTSYGETSFSKLLAPDDVSESGIAAGNEVCLRPACCLLLTGSLPTVVTYQLPTTTVI